MTHHELNRLNQFGNYDKFGGFYDATEVDAAIAELKEKLEDAQREVCNYRRHANECEGRAAKGNIDVITVLEDIKDVKNDNELLEAQLYGFLELEEKYGVGDLGKYIDELKAENERLKAELAEHYKELEDE